jgi:hypothetical protein
VFLPLKRTYEVPVRSRLAEDRAFLIDLSNPAQEGVLLKPLGYHLFKHTSEDLKVDWKEAPADVTDVPELSQEGEQGHSPSFADKLQDVLVKGLEIADKVVVSHSDGQLQVRLHNTAYIGTCESLREEAPQVCEQIGCPLCSLIACIYTEHANVPTFIKEAQSDERDITITCAEQPQS